MIDTAKLFNPTSHPDNSGASDVNMFKRNILLIQPDYYLTLNEQEHKFETTDELKSFISLNKKEIQKDLFYIITDSNTTFKKTVSIIDILVANQITNYKVINIQKYFTPPEPITIQSPTIVTETFNEAADSAFIITIQQKSFKVTILNTTDTILTSLEALNKFIEVNKPKNDYHHKIIISVPRKLIDKKLNPVVEVLKRNNYSNYLLSTTD